MKNQSTSNTEEKAFENIKHNALHLNFPNGNKLSTIWGRGSYTENHDFTFDESGNIKDFWTFIGSNNVEIMFACDKKLEKKIFKKFIYDSQPIGYLTILQWVEIVKMLSKEVK
jgi:hypothetical protein